MVLMKVVYSTHRLRLYLQAFSSKLVPWFTGSLAEEFRAVTSVLKEVFSLQSWTLEKFLKGLHDTGELFSKKYQSQVWSQSRPLLWDHFVLFIEEIRSEMPFLPLKGESWWWHHKSPERQKGLLHPSHRQEWLVSGLFWTMPWMMSLNPWSPRHSR